VNLLYRVKTFKKFSTTLFKLKIKLFILKRIPKPFLILNEIIQK
jgi:hypothetical protein